MTENSQDNSQRDRAEHIRRFRWQPGGPSPNPGGRPKKRPITSGYRKLLATELPPEMLKDRNGKELFPSGTTWLDLVIGALVRKAASGDVRAIRELREAIEGRSGLRLEVLSEEPENETPDDPLVASFMELDPADRSLIIAATRKVLDLTMDELAAGEAQGRPPESEA